MNLYASLCPKQYTGTSGAPAGSSQYIMNKMEAAEEGLKSIVKCVLGLMVGSGTWFPALLGRKVQFSRVDRAFDCNILSNCNAKQG